MIDFGGWTMPVYYSGIMEEHHAVRHAVGMFDISHMGQVFVSGHDSAKWLDRLLTNCAGKLEPGQGHYSLMLNEQGGVIDDLFVYRLEPERWLLVVNASKRADVQNWMRRFPGVTLNGPGNDRAAIAVQGPHSPALVKALFDISMPDRNEWVALPGEDTFLAATGYTGEEGFEIFLPASEASTMWERLLVEGESHGLKPCGLGARDTLRLEKCYPLNGSDLSPSKTPLEAGLGMFVDFTKEDFIGRQAVWQQKQMGVPTVLRAFRMLSKSPPPRSHYPIWSGDRQVAEVSSGTLSPSLGIGIGLAYLPVEYAKIGDQIEISIRDKRFPAILHKKPLYP